ncbi:MAG: PstS family phosphate ABC transporter substrate-binding protein [Bacteroidota bacterium]
MHRPILIITLISIVVFGCQHNKTDSDDTLVSGVIAIAADENMQNILEAELDAFSVHYPEAFVFPKYLEEKEAIRYLIDDSVKLIVVGRDLDIREKELLPKTRVIRKYPFGYEGIAFIINKQNTDSILSPKQIKQLIMGQINSWKEINKNSPLGTVKIFFVDKSNGVMRYISDSITRGSQDVSKHFYVVGEGQNIFDKIAEDPNNIGIVGMNQFGNLNSVQYEANSSKVRIVRISKGDKATLSDSYLPYAGDVYNGNYPFWRPLYVIISESREGLARGLCFFLTQQIGQKVVLKAGIMPITDVHKTMTRWDE